jgi:hypothetical protein
LRVLEAREFEDPAIFRQLLSPETFEQFGVSLSWPVASVIRACLCLTYSPYTTIKS